VPLRITGGAFCQPGQFTYEALHDPLRIRDPAPAQPAT